MKKFSSAASQKKREDKKYNIIMKIRETTREKDARQNTRDEREGKEKNDDIRCNNQYSYEYYH